MRLSCLILFFTALFAFASSDDDPGQLPARVNTTRDAPVIPQLNASTFCDRISSTFNSLNSIMPMAIKFAAGEAVGIKYPDGQILLKSNAKRLGSCVVYTITKASTIVAHFELADSFTIHFPKFLAESGESCDVRVEIDNCKLVLHYELRHDEKGLLQLRPLMGELKTLGSAGSQSPCSSLNGLDLSREAEDVLRPKLFKPFDQFTADQLTWTLDPNDLDLSNDGFEAFRLVFKRSMVSLDSIFNNKQ